MTDAYTSERASFRERLARMSGGTTYRAPMEGHGTKSDTMPDVHTMAAALAYARQGEGDIGPDIALAIVCQTDYRRQRIVNELAAVLLAATGKVGSDARRCCRSSVGARMWPSSWAYRPSRTRHGPSPREIGSCWRAWPRQR
ncbi:hypothetical protein WCN79_01950 [Xanthomonas axonopodis pv. vasculorum]|uniref:hypothetical protein n=1 Tax=Xanthomonas axonopodis TaxID=53413 RepID=UPI001FD2FC90|nr:hypothetical protein [Xanthomonas axonopodis]